MVRKTKLDKKAIILAFSTAFLFSFSVLQIPTIIETMKEINSKPIIMSNKAKLLSKLFNIVSTKSFAKNV